MAATAPCPRTAAQHFLTTYGVKLVPVLDTSKLLDDEHVRRILTNEESEGLKAKDNDLAKAVELIRIANTKTPEEVLQFVQLLKKHEEDIFKTGDSAGQLAQTLHLLNLESPSGPLQPAMQSHENPTAAPTSGSAQTDGAAAETVEAAAQGTPWKTKNLRSDLLRRMMGKVADSISKTYTCKRLAIELNVDKTVVETLIEQFSDPNEVAFELLDKWKSIHSTDATPDWLLRSLRSIGKKDLADEMAEEFSGELQLARGDPDLKRPAREPAAMKIWEEIYKKHRVDLETRLATTDGIALSCWSENLITHQELQHLKNERDCYKHNTYLLDALGRQSADSFPAFVGILANILDGQRYGDLVRSLREDYFRITGKALRY